MSIHSYRTVDREQLASDIKQLHLQALDDLGPEDFRHMKRMERWGQGCSLLGYATAWIAPNPISALLISQGSFTRWTQVAHPIQHRGYDKVGPGSRRYKSKRFAQGWRRFLDWPDWMTPEGWHHEHDGLHHYRLGELVDPNNAQHNMEWLRQSKLPMWLRYTNRGPVLRRLEAQLLHAAHPQGIGDQRRTTSASSYPHDDALRVMECVHPARA